ncbi:MAG: hypothetical protein RMK89_11245 [Armatimonadota bacterium]|nr:hypothetical protein [Armatimonadota bacterium]MDW8144024.1 hypothetical protein [Armatimonadota bacterium]
MSQKPFDREEAKRWLEGQRAANEIIKRERVQFLLSLTPEKSLAIYLSLWEANYKIPKEPSFVLMKMRQCIERLTIRSKCSKGDEGR